jgi:hypothetical protein
MRRASWTGFSAKKKLSNSMVSQGDGSKKDVAPVEVRYSSRSGNQSDTEFVISSLILKHTKGIQLVIQEVRSQNEQDKKSIK